MAEHATGVLRRRQITTAIAAGLVSGPQVTPVAEPLGAAMRSTGIMLRDLLRVENGRYWSYVCQDPGCCPPDGVLLDGLAHPAAAALDAAGLTARPDRASLASTMAPLTGPAAESMGQATERALRRAEELIAAAPRDEDALRPVVDAGRAAVRAAIGTYRRGGRITRDRQVRGLAKKPPFGIKQRSGREIGPPAAEEDLHGPGRARCSWRPGAGAVGPGPAQRLRGHGSR